MKKNLPLEIKRTSNGRFYVSFLYGSPRFISKDDVPKWAAKILQALDDPELAAEHDKIQRQLSELQHEEVAASTSTTQAKGEPTMGEKLKTAASATSTSLKLKGSVELDYDEKQLGWILRGFVEGARGRGPSPSRMFESGGPSETDKERERHAKLLELGRELFANMSVATTYFSISQQEWSGWYAHLGGGHEGHFLAQPARPSTSLGGGSRWLPPVVGRITGRFGDARPGGPHEAIDIAVPTGTPVVAPQTMRVTEAGFGNRAGRYVVAQVQRDNGEFDGDGYRLTFAHLSDIKVEKGQVLQRGEVLGLSGATGNVTGPHLHFRVQWVDDGVFSDDVVSIDPLGVIPESVFAGRVAPQPAPGGQVLGLQKGRPMNVIVAPGAGRVSIGHGIINPDTDVRVGSPDVQLQSYQQQVEAEANDPLAGIVTAASNVLDFAPDFIRTTGDIASAAGTIASVGGKVVSVLYPPAAPVAGTVSTVGTAVGVAGSPVGHLAGGAVEVAGNIAQGDDPLAGILT